MKFKYEPISYYIDKLKSGDHFAQVGYSDAEWYCMIRYSLGSRTGLGQILDAKTGDKLLDVLKRRQDDPRWLFAAPNCLWKPKVLPPRRVRDMNVLMSKHKIKTTWYERDMITDDLTKQGNLFPFIEQLRKMDTVLIGPTELQTIDFLGNNHHVTISSPNLHLKDGNKDGIENAVERAFSVVTPGAIFLVSAGLSAALIIDQLYNRLTSVENHNSFFDCGSMWDAFVGIGMQRGWRAELYQDPKKVEQWKHDNLFGKQRD